MACFCFSSFSFLVMLTCWDIDQWWPYVSDSITIESPILIRACMSLPSGTAWRASSLALNAFLYQSIAAAAPLIARYGVTVRNPGGTGAFLDFTGFFACAFLDLDLGMDGGLVGS